MKKLIASFCLLGAVAFFSGCGFAPISGKPVGIGFLYADTQANEMVTENPTGQKQGEACASTILGLVATGDASVAAAARQAGITKIASVDGKHNNILGIYSTYCTVVTGD